MKILFILSKGSSSRDAMTNTRDARSTTARGKPYASPIRDMRCAL